MKKTQKIAFIVPAIFATSAFADCQDQIASLSATLAAKESAVAELCDASEDYEAHKATCDSLYDSLDALSARISALVSQCRQ
ncbi:MAG: hypothetical protein AB7T49_04175 [Oligoflexales bacterium]